MRFINDLYVRITTFLWVAILALLALLGIFIPKIYHILNKSTLEVINKKGKNEKTIKRRNS